MKKMMILLVMVAVVLLLGVFDHALAEPPRDGQNWIRFAGLRGQVGSTEKQGAYYNKTSLQAIPGQFYEVTLWIDGEGYRRVFFMMMGGWYYSTIGGSPSNYSPVIENSGLHTLLKALQPPPRPKSPKKSKPPPGETYGQRLMREMNEE